MNQLSKHSMIVNPSASSQLVEKAESNDFDSFDSKLSFVIFFNFILVLTLALTTSKYYVDVCLSPQTGTIFPASLGAPSEICQVIRQRDLADRKHLTEWAGKKTFFSTAQLRTLLRNPADIITNPTIFLTDATVQTDLLWWALIFVFITALSLWTLIATFLKVAAQLFEIRRPRSHRRRMNSKVVPVKTPSGKHWTTRSVANG